MFYKVWNFIFSFDLVLLQLFSLSMLHVLQQSSADVSDQD